MRLSTEEISKRIQEYLVNLDEILTGLHIHGEDTFSSDSDLDIKKFEKWELYFLKFLENVGLHSHAEEFSKLIPLELSYPVDTLVKRIEDSHVNFVQCLLYELKKFPSEILTQIEDTPSTIVSGKYKRNLSPEGSTGKTQSSPNEKPVLTGSKVFIVHGHDKANLYELRDLLKDKFGLESIILFKEAAKGRTIIKKFEDEAPNAGYAFILMTPDDQVIPPGKKKIEYAQARPNVFFELGWFCRRLGREKICILFKKGTKIHSDFEGIERAEFNNSVEEVVLKIEKELKAAKLIE